MVFKKLTRLPRTTMLVFYLLEGGDIHEFRNKARSVPVKKLDEKIISAPKGMVRRDYDSIAPPLDPAKPNAQWYLHAYLQAETFTDGTTIKHNLAPGEYIDDGERVMWHDGEVFNDSPKADTDIITDATSVTDIKRKRIIKI